MLFLVLHFLLYLLVSSKFPLVLSTPKWKYCGQIGECKPGEHIMCIYHKAESMMSSKCIGNPINITTENRQRILTKINKMRSETRHGIVTGKNNFLLPEGYDLKDLEWDDELARFAQVWTNQCSFNNGDLCYATDRFPSPGQFMGAIQYAFPNLKGLSVTEESRRSKDTVYKKASDLIESILNFVYDTKNYVTKDMILNHVGSGRSNLFLLAVYGKTTHIGCAMSYWVSADGRKTNGGYDFYTISLVCNLSAQPVAGEKVYETNPVLLQTPSNFNLGYTENYQNGVLPAVVLMPIMGTEELAMTEKSHKLKRVAATVRQRPLSNHAIVAVKDRYFDKTAIDDKQKHHIDGDTRNKHVAANKKSAIRKHISIFNRVPKFELPSQHHQSIKETSHEKIFSGNKLSTMLSEYSTNKQSQAFKLMQPLTTTDNINSHMYPSDFSISSAKPKFYNDLSEDRLINFMYNLIQKADINLDELVNVTADVVQDKTARNLGNATSKNNKKYPEYSHSDIENRTITGVDNILVRKETQLTGLRKLNPLMRHEISLVTYNENDINTHNRKNNYNKISNNVRDIRKTDDMHPYGRKFGSYTRSVENDKNENCQTAEHISIGRHLNWDRFTKSNSHESQIKNRHERVANSKANDFVTKNALNLMSLS